MNCLMRFAVLAALQMTQIGAHVRKESGAGLLGQLRAGLTYAYGFFPTRCALLLLAISSVCLQSSSSLMPWFASARFHGDSHTLGLLYSASGLGAVCGMLYLASRSTIRGLFKVMGWSAGAASVALILFAWTPVLELALALMFVSGLGMMLTAASTNTVLQSIVPDELRGRVAALYVMSFLGMSPLGSLFSGWVAHELGSQEALTLCAGIGLFASLVFAYHFARIRQQLVPLYKTLNIPQHDQ